MGIGFQTVDGKNGVAPPKMGLGGSLKFPEKSFFSESLNFYRKTLSETNFGLVYRISVNKLFNILIMISLAKNLSTQANISDTPFGQKSPGHPEVGVLNCHRHTNRHRNSMTESA